MKRGRKNSYRVADPQGTLRTIAQVVLRSEQLPQQERLWFHDAAQLFASGERIEDAFAVRGHRGSRHKTAEARARRAVLLGWVRYLAVHLACPVINKTPPRGLAEAMARLLAGGPAPSPGAGAARDAVLRVCPGIPRTAKQLRSILKSEIKWRI